ncbi:Protein PAIR1 [Camellia lanceoleosa]|uniref:Protein PAIR1 n=1 Tax=Camellia lanceoleosa TaxID=1840588 RepID=A0ACC0GHJ3_9ERIC|nr:Protein PAIR1 [Camellia lanceoleosa]
MKLKINKACYLNSILVLPPYARFERRSGTVPNGMDRSQSQPSQQSFSQGVSSQHGMFFQLSQNSLDEIVTNDQRIGSQERENSVKKIACLPPISYTFGMIWDSVQSDIMHVNKATKEALVESVRQKLIANDNFMQLMGQEVIKTNLVGGLNSVSDQVSQEIDQDRLKEISSMISALPKQIDLCLQKLKSELCKTVTQEMQACSIVIP